MKKMREETHKRKINPITPRFSDEELDLIDLIRCKYNLTRSAMVRNLTMTALNDDPMVRNNARLSKE